MAGNNRVASLWTTVVTALVAFFAVLGFGAAAKAAAGPALSGPATAVPSPSERPLAAVAAAATSTAFGTASRLPVQDRRSRRAVLRGGALPPTIAQRIRAEAHGSSPSVRRSTTADATAAGHVTPQDLDLVA